MPCSRSIVASVLAALGCAAHAADLDLSLKSRAVAAAASPKAAAAAFAPGSDPWTRSPPNEARERGGPRASCEYSTRDICYDLTQARVVYRPARRYMPSVGGLTPENVSLRRHRIIFTYSFR